jgi:bacillithiol biosynthesis deacetylase BshB1
MAFGAHPDDIEVGCGGTLIKLVERGRSVALVDLTRGELSTRGDVERRQREAAEAARRIGAVARENLGLQDGDIRLDDASKRRVAQVIRAYRPKAVLAPYFEDRHPDHYHAAQLLYDGIFLAGLQRYDTGQPHYRPSRLYYYMLWHEFEPTFVVDISAQYEHKREAVFAYESQFLPVGSDEQTRLSGASFGWQMEHRMAHYGSLIGVQYGEALLIRGRMAVDDPLDVQFSTF